MLCFDISDSREGEKIMSKTLSEKIAEAVEIIKNVNFEEKGTGKYIINDDFYMMLQTYESNEPEKCGYESHKNYVDIQYIVEGVERMDIAPISILKVKEAYDPEKDVAFYHVPEQAASMVLTAGGYVVFYPEDGHRPGMCVGKPAQVKKIVGKVRVD